MDLPLIYRNIKGKMMAVAVCGFGAGCNDDPIAVETDSVIFKLNPNRDYKVEIKPGRDGKHYWSRIHRGKVRSTGHQGFDTYKLAQNDEQFDCEMLQQGIGALVVED